MKDNVIYVLEGPMSDERYDQLLEQYRQQQQEMQVNYELSLDKMRQQLQLMRSENEILRQIAVEYFQSAPSRNIAR